MVERFESEFAELVGARHCVAVSSGTAALHLALHVLGLEPGAEVVTTPLTWIATHHAIAYERATAVPADIEAGTGNLDPARVAERLTERSGAVLAVHYGGYPCDLDALAHIAADAGVPLIEDCAHALGAAYRSRRIGAGDNLQCFSFNPTKNLTTGTGGAIATANAEQADRLRRLRSLGLPRSTSRRMREDGTPFRVGYGLSEPGFRYEMSDLNAAIGLAQMNVLAAHDDRRREVAAAYADGLRTVPGIELLRHDAPERQSAHHLFVVLAERRDELAAALAARGVEVGMHYPPNELIAVDEGELPNFERFRDRALSLPLHAGLSDGDADAVIAAVRAGW